MVIPFPELQSLQGTCTALGPYSDGNGAFSHKFQVTQVGYLDSQEKQNLGV